MIKWAPLNVPLKRRLQTLSIFIYVFTVTYGVAIGYVLSVVLIFTRLWWLNMMYFLYAVNSNCVVAFYSSLRSEWFRSWRIWQYASDYFPIKLVKTVELDPSKNYLALGHPHGLLMISQWFVTASNALDFSKTFPGIKSYIATGVFRFGAPYVRELLVFGGGCLVTEESLLYNLDKKKHQGRFVLMNTGGAAEVMITSKKDYNLYLKNRRGFARVALKSGAGLVPVFCFGENKMFDSAPSNNGPLRKFQFKVRHALKIALVAPLGRGFFNYNFGMLPHRVPIHVVVGAPVEVPHILDPTPEQVDEVHARFLQAVRDLFEEHKHKYESDPDVQLNIM